MKQLLAILALFFALGLHAQQPLAWGDQGNGTYKNPVLCADFSDPDVIRVGEKYYMVASDFHFMGMQVLESDDMVNWRYVSQIYHRLDNSGCKSRRTRKVAQNFPFAGTKAASTSTSAPPTKVFSCRRHRRPKARGSRCTWFAV